MGTYLTLKRLGKADCGERMTQAESRKVQLDMLDSLASFCDKNGLRYFLSTELYWGQFCVTDLFLGRMT